MVRTRMLRSIKLLNNYIKRQKYDEEEKHRNIDYHSLNKYLIDKTGKDFYRLKIYEYLDQVNTDDITYKLINVPETHTLHELDANNNDTWISCKAMIKNITDVQVDVKQAVFVCHECNTLNYVDADPIKGVQIPQLCINNSSCGGTSRDLILDKENTTYRNYKLVKLEEPLELRSGGNTREFKGLLLDYLASPEVTLKAGDVVDVTGLFTVESRKVRGKAEGYEFIIRIHNITPVEDVFEDSRITQEDIEEIKELSQNPNIYDMLVNTLAPEVYGYDLIKQGLLLSLFEGNRPVEDTYKTDYMDRWTIHILLIGDPGIGKSQLIQAIKKRAPKNITISGTNTSQAGLTNSAVKDELTGTWTLEAGAVVLADTGVLCIDEFDKLSPAAQKSLNEPMEQLSIGSAKAGLVQNMSARTTIIAAANPKYGKFNNRKTIHEQLDIADSTLSRFDLLFVLEDMINEDDDRELANALLNKEFIVEESELIELDMFKKYITYAKANCFPVLSSDAKIMLREFYVNTRQAAIESDDGKPITPRDLKALERMSIARAKSELREFVTSDDAKCVLNIYKGCLDKLGLSIETAGELQNIRSDKENSIYSDVRDMVSARMDIVGLPFDAGTEKELRIEAGMVCHDTKLDGDRVFDEVMYEIKKSL